MIVASPRVSPVSCEAKKSRSYVYSLTLTMLVYRIVESVDMCLTGSVQKLSPPWSFTAHTLYHSSDLGVVLTINTFS
jgi:hypothetical protein